MAKIIIVGNKKGGISKSTLTSLLANYMQREGKGRILVIDADYDQFTLYKERQKEIAQDKIPLDAKIYDIIKVHYSEVPDILLEAEDDYDYIFIDVRGEFSTPEIVQLYALADTIFIPTGPSSPDLEASKEFYRYYKDRIAPELDEPANVVGVLAKVDPKMKMVKNLINNAEEELPFPLLEKVMPENKKAFQEQFSTFATYKHYKDSSMFDLLCEEMYKQIN